MAEKPAAQQTNLFGEPIVLPEVKPLTPIKRRIINASVEIQQEPLEQADYLHTVLCQVGMPRKQTTDREFERSNGHMSLSLEAGSLFDGHQLVKQPLPYGARPRLVMVHISSEAVRRRSPIVEVGHSAYEFMRTLGFDTNGASYRNTRKQLMALAACRMTLGFMANGQPRTVKTEPIRRFDAWLKREGEQMVMWPGVLELSPDFYETLLDHAVPLDHTALAALKHSALAIDIYTWLAHRLVRVPQVQGVKVSWGNMRAQFGQEYADPKNFKREFRQALRHVLVVYPDAKVQETAGGLLLKESRPPIAPASITVPRLNGGQG